MRRAICASLVGGLLALPTLPTPASAATPRRVGPGVAPATQADTAASSGIHDWNNLARLRGGDKVIVTTRQSRLLRGRFVGHTADAMTFMVEGELVAIDREHVAEVQRQAQSHTFRNAVLTLGVSLLVGAIAGTGAEASSDPDQASQTASSLSREAGAATNEALPEHTVIYRVPGSAGS